LIAHFSNAILAVGLIAFGTIGAAGQSYPNKPIRIVLAGAGGTSDFVARQIAQGISGPLGQPVVVDNRSDVVAIEIIARAQPDGYNLLISANTIWIGPLLHKVSYDIDKDFAPLTLLVRAPNILVVTPSLPVNSVSDLIAVAKARPGELNYASSVSGSSSHLAAELFKSMAKINIVRIPYKSGSLAINDLIVGRVQMMFGPVASMVPNIKLDRLKALAVTSAQPSALLPGLPTVASAGMPGYESEALSVMFAPARTPFPILKRLNEEIVRVLHEPEIKAKFLDIGLDPVGSSPEELSSTMKSEMVRMGKVVRDSGIKLD